MIRYFLVVLAMGWGLAQYTTAAETLPETIAEVQPKVVKLFGAGGLRNLAAYGTGLSVSPEGHIVTVWSHLLDNDVVTVVLWDGRRFYGKLVGADSAHDVAVIKIEAEGLPHFDLNDAASAGPGARVLAFSNMFKVATGDEPASVQAGVIAAVTDLSARRGRYEVPYHGPVYVVDAVTNNPGSAGGALTTRDGRLLGMIGRELMNSDTNTWLNYSVPISEIRSVVEDIISGTYRQPDPLASTEDNSGSVRLADLGLILVPDVVYRTPAYVDAVLPDSPAAKLGLAPDDLIVFANGELVHSIRAFHEVLTRLMPGDDLTLVIRRDDSLKTLTLRIPLNQ